MTDDGKPLFAAPHPVSPRWNRIYDLHDRVRVCWEMAEVFLRAKDAHGLHDMGVEIQGLNWAIRELEELNDGPGEEIRELPPHDAA